MAGVLLINLLDNRPQNTLTFQLGRSVLSSTNYLSINTPTLMELTARFTFQTFFYSRCSQIRLELIVSANDGCPASADSDYFPRRLKSSGNLI